MCSQIAGWQFYVDIWSAIYAQEISNHHRPVLSVEHQSQDLLDVTLLQDKVYISCCRSNSITWVQEGKPIFQRCFLNTARPKMLHGISPKVSVVFDPSLLYTASYRSLRSSIAWTRRNIRLSAGIPELFAHICQCRHLSFFSLFWCVNKQYHDWIIGSRMIWPVAMPKSLKIFLVNKRPFISSILSIASFAAGDGPLNLVGF